MAFYTTLTRSILESKAGYTESQGSSQIDTVISKSWNKVFTTSAEMFDETYRQVICSKILKHYYMREIGMETVGLWEYYMNRTFEECVPYYNQLWKSQLLEFSPFDDVNLTTSNTKSGTTDTKDDLTRSGKDTETSGKDITKNGTKTTDNTTANTNAYSDTPQGALTDVTNMKYLTNATVDNGSDNTDETWNDTENETGNRTVNTSGTEGRIGKVTSTEEYLNTVKGKSSGTSYSKLLTEYRDTFLNIDIMFIQKFETCFMQIWHI